MGSRGDAVASSLDSLVPKRSPYFVALAHSVPCAWSALGAAGPSAWLPHLFRSLPKCHFPSAPSKSPLTSPTLSLPLLLSTVSVGLVHIQQTLHRLYLFCFPSLSLECKFVQAPIPVWFPALSGTWDRTGLRGACVHDRLLNE